MTESGKDGFVVQPPFDMESTGDCILQTPKGTKFKVLQAILCMASSIFKDMFDLPTVTSSATQESTALPIIPVQEDAETLQALLQMLYPIDPPPIKSLQLAQKLLGACDKYFVSTAKLRLYLRCLLSDDQFLKEEPSACYALSWKLGFQEEAIRVFRYTHSLDLTDSLVAGQIMAISGDLEAFLTLLRLRTLREQSVDGLLSLVVAYEPPPSSHRHGFPSVIVGDYRQRRAHLIEVLKKAHPDCDEVEGFLGFRVSPCPAYDCVEARTLRLDATRAKTIAALERYPQTISYS